MDAERSTAPTVVVAVSEPPFREEVGRWAAAVGAEAVTASGPADVRRHWTQAAAVVVDTGMATELLAAGVARRPHVLLVDPLSGGDHVWRLAVDLGAARVCRPTVDDQTIALDALAAALDGRGDACVVAVVGAVGGVGASTFAAQLARGGAARHWRTMFGDLDPAGGIDLLLGAERVEGARWDTLDLAGGRLPAGALMKVLPQHGELSFLTTAPDTRLAPVVPDAVISAARRAADLVVLDVPRDPAALDVVTRAELTVVVVPEDVRGIAAARHLVPALGDLAGTAVAVGRSARGGVGRGGLDGRLGIPVVGRLRTERRLAHDVASGRGPSESRGARRTVATVLGLVGLDGRRP